MNQQGLFGFWLYLLSMCVLVYHGRAQVPEPAQCLLSGTYNLTQQPVEGEDEGKCWRDCYAEPDCHMAVIVLPLRDRKQCLLVNCLNQGRHSYTRDPSTQIRVYPKTTIDNDQRYYYMTDAYERADETLHCSELMSCSSCQSGTHRFFYNRTSYRCESFPSGCGSSRNSFETQEGCEALCNEKFRCYRPVQYGAGSSNMPMFFFNKLSYSCERFNFRGHGSNGNIFHSEEECEKLCGDIKAPTTPPPAVTTDTTVTVTTRKPAPRTKKPVVLPVTQPPDNSDWFIIPGFVVLVVVVAICTGCEC
ncbi:tissue factor pathway inhibitor-like [Scomber japonicus]|uniref:tissue factor pathway inhibitor-like n=1 Tax=Scomber japonicus TaxID=13676 RepID=UPI002305D02E|nr:tissue factor pathway inhibitor-like [Scomber japonicus]